MFGLFGDCSGCERPTTVKRLLERLAEPPGCLERPAWHWVAGAEEETLAPPSEGGKAGGIEAVVREAARRGRLLRTTPDDWWRVLVSRWSYVMVKYAEYLLFSMKRNALRLEDAGNVAEVTAERLVEAMEEQSTVIAELYGTLPLTYFVDADARSTKTIHFDRRDTADSLPGIIVVGDCSDWENMRQQVLELIKILREWEPPMSAAAAPSSSDNRKGSKNKSISSIKSRYWTERALRLLDAPMMESALGKLLDTVGGKDTGAWWGKILVAGGGGGGEERPGWLPRLLHFHTVCKNKQVKERDIVGATVHHLTLTLDDRLRRISRVCLLEGVAGYIKGEDEDEKWLQCRHSWALFAEDSSVFHRQFKRNKRKCKR